MPGNAIGVWNGRAGWWAADRFENFTGTAACILLASKRTGDLMLLGARHVIAPFHVDGGPGFLDDLIWCEHAGKGPSPIGSPVAYTNILFDDRRSWSLDAALIAVKPDYAQWVLERFRAAGLPAGTADVSVGDQVWTEGYASGQRREGAVRDINVSTPVEYYVDSSGTTRSARFTGLIETDDISTGGDSGAALFTAGNCVAGLLVGGKQGERSLFCKIDAVLDYFAEFEVQLFTHAEVERLNRDAARAEKSPGSTARALPDPQADILARTLWGEARGEELRGIRAVAAVVLNRASRHPAWWWGDSIVGVCKKPYQFSCWNSNDPNYKKLIAVNTRDGQFRECLHVAAETIAGRLADPTAGATHYHHREILPNWARGHTPSAHIGRHLFYNDIEPLPSRGAQ